MPGVETPTDLHWATSSVVILMAMLRGMGTLATQVIGTLVVVTP